VNFENKKLMCNIKKIYLSIIILSFASLVAAQNIEFVAKANKTVASGESFQLQYVVNSANAEKLQIPDITDFDIVAGPSSYTQTSFEFINGKSRSSMSTIYTYMLVAQKEGNFSIAPATITVEGKQYKSNPLSIKVLPPNSKAPQERQQQAESSSTQISGEDIFIRPMLSKTTVKEQEMVLLTYKLYYTVNLIDARDAKFPDFKGLMTYDVENRQNAPDVENYNGKNYYSIILAQKLIAPQRTGKIDISPMSCTAVVRVRNNIRVPTFSNYSMYQDVKKKVVSGAVSLDVTPLPQPKPENFCGVVGSMSMTSEISSTTLTQNSSATLKININGTGNLKLIGTPKIPFPSDIETYDPKVINNFSVNSSGFSGRKSIEYLFIPRHQGKWEIPEISLSYFDLASNSYKTLSTQPYTLNVERGTDNQATEVSNYTEQEKVKQLASDIRYIKTGNLNIEPMPQVFTGTLPFYLMYLIPLLIAVLLGLFFHKQIKNSADIAMMKNKKANRVAKTRLKTAERHLKVNQKELFYDEVLSALWLYLSDKLNLPLSSLNRENVSEKLLEHNVEVQISEEFLSLLKNSEFERYTPSSASQSAMDKIYSDAVDVIEKLEKNVK
jgi:hypothetical protein